MDFKVIKGINHYVYDDIKEFRAFKPDEPYIDNWRHANENDWVITDDGHFCQILKKGNDGTTQYVRTVLGQFATNNMKALMLG